MDLQTLLNSGTLELYVLDRLDPDERRRVEAYAREYPEVREEITAIEEALEQYTVLQGTRTPPPPEALTEVLSRLPAGTPPPPPPADSAGGTPARPATGQATSGSLGGVNWIPWLLALALGAALFTTYYYYQGEQDRQQEINELRQRFTTLEQDCERIRDANRENQQQLALLSDADTRSIVLAGTENAPESRAVVFYNAVAGEVLFSAANLPVPPAGKQYQLWVIDAEGPHDLGVLARDTTAGTLRPVRYVPEAAAFAITLEDEGGQPTPDLSQLQVIGEVGGGAS